MTESKTPVPLFDLTRQWLEVKDDVHAAVERVFATQQFILGPEVAGLEKECAEYLGVKRAIGVTSGTDALLAALMALDVGPGDEVITTPFTFFATAGVVDRLGARTGLRGHRPARLQHGPRQARRRDHASAPRRSSRCTSTARPSTWTRIRRRRAASRSSRTAASRSAPTTRAFATGGLGLFGCFSFFPTKNLGAFGDGGLVTTNDEALADKHASTCACTACGPSTSTTSSAATSASTPCRRRSCASSCRASTAGSPSAARVPAHYRQLFTDAGLLGTVTLPEELPGRGHTYHQYVVRVRAARRAPRAPRASLVSAPRSTTRCRSTSRSASPTSATARRASRCRSRPPGGHGDADLPGAAGRRARAHGRGNRELLRLRSKEAGRK